MKPSFIPVLLGLLTLAFSTQCEAQNKKSKTDRDAKSPAAHQSQDKVNREFSLRADAGRSTLAVYNIFGSVTVQGYAGDKVLVEATRTLASDTAPGLATGTKEAVAGFEQSGDSVIVYLTGPFDTRPRPNRTGRNYQPDYSFHFDFVVKVPYAMNLHVATVNDGTVLVQDVTGQLEAYNVNGAVKLLGAKGATKARTVNGNVDATYADGPAGPCSYHTINGKINVTYPREVAANVHFKSMHGELYTDFPSAELLPVQATQSTQGGGSSTRYKLTKDTVVRLGKGGPDCRFETLNGDVTIKQQTR
jgi:hypothetical protein